MNLNVPQGSREKKTNSILETNYNLCNVCDENTTCYLSMLSRGRYAFDAGLVLKILK